MTRNLSRWAALYVWESSIAKELAFYAVTFDRLICIRMARPGCYIAYFTVKGRDGHVRKRFAQYTVKFSPGGSRLISAYLILWSYDMKCLLQNLDKNKLIFDRLSEFTWIQSLHQG